MKRSRTRSAALTLRVQLVGARRVSERRSLFGRCRHDDVTNIHVDGVGIDHEQSDQNRLHTITTMNNELGKTDRSTGVREKRRQRLEEVMC